MKTLEALESVYGGNVKGKFKPKSEVVGITDIYL